MTQKSELTPDEVADFLNVSPSFVIKQMDAGTLRSRQVGRHRLIGYDDLVIYQSCMQRVQDDALHALARQAQELGLDG